MSEFTEAEYMDYLEERLAHVYGAANVERGKYLSDSQRYVDFHVQTFPADLAIEVENDSNSLIEGTGQAILYAAHEENWTPVVIVPEQVDGYDVESRLLGSNIAVAEIPFPRYQ